MAQSRAEIYRISLTTRLAAAPLSAKLMQSGDLRRAILVTMDVIVIAATFFTIYRALLLSASQTMTSNSFAATGVFAVVWLVSLVGGGAYSLRHTRAGSVEYKRVISATLVAGGSMGIVYYATSYDYPRIFFGSWLLLGLAGICIGRFVRRHLMHYFHTHELFTTPLLIAGSSGHVDEVVKVLRRESWIGYRIRGAVTDEPVSATRTGVPVLGPLAELSTLLETTAVPIVVFAEGSFDSPAQFRRLAWQLERSNVQMILAPTLADVSAQRLEFRPVAGLPLVDVARPTAAKSLRWLKRLMDIVGSAGLLLIAGPILLAAMIAIKLEDSGPIFFRQRRVGLEGREFDCLKLRSMCVDAEERLAALQAQNEGAGVLFKMKDDPRITKVGKIIRRYSIDELPQLWNTLTGDMSLVGPRPALPREVARYDFDTRRRLRVRPGLTGLWQVSGRSSLSWEDTVRLDLYYVDNWSLVQDLMILLKTAKAVVGSDGAY